MLFQVQCGSAPSSFQKQPPEVRYEKIFFRNFTEFTGKHLRQSLFFNKIAGFNPATLLYSGTGAFL